MFTETETIQYNAVLSLLEDITRAIEATPHAKETISIKFKMKKWIDSNAVCSEAELANCALEKIRQDPKQFPIVVAMFRETAGMDIIADRLEQKNRN